MNSLLLQKLSTKTCSSLTVGQWLDNLIFLEKERAPSLYIFGRSDCRFSVDTDLVEFRQLQEVEVFSYLLYSLAKSHVNGLECFRACFSSKFNLKSFESSGKNSYLCGREQCHPRVSLFT